MGVNLTVSIVNWNTSELLEKCLNSVYKNNSGLNAEVIVVDNASSDGSPEMVEKKFPKTILIKNKKNEGFAAAHNKAIKKSKGKYIAIVNSDCIILKDAFKKILNFMEKNIRIGAASFKLFNEDRSVQKNCCFFPTLYSETIARIPFFNKFILKEECLKTKEVENFTGACYVVRKKALDEVGLFDESFFAYMEETELFYRMNKVGWKIFYFPESCAIHLGGKSTSSDVYRKSLQYRGVNIFFKKHYGTANLIALRFVTTLSALAEILLSAFSSSEKAKENLKISVEMLKINFGMKK